MQLDDHIGLGFFSFGVLTMYKIQPWNSENGIIEKLYTYITI
jgi:hypothetical protein